MRCDVDTDVWIDLFEGGLIAEAATLGSEFTSPADMGGLDDIAGVYGELAVYAAPDPDELAKQGVQFIDLPGGVVDDFARLTTVYTGCSRVDLGALALAKVGETPLLTGDNALRRAAESENVVVHGTEWLLDRMLESGAITTSRIAQFREDMRAAGRRVPII